MSRTLKIALTAVAVLAAAVGAATVIRALDGGDTTPPGAPTSPQPTGHRPDSPDPSFWNPDRLRSASPADMPGVDQ